MRRASGSLIGSAGGLVFVLVNAGNLPAGWAGAVRVAGVAGFVLAVWFGVIRVWRVRDTAVPTRSALRTYGWSVLAMAVAIPVGAQLLVRSGAGSLTLPWVVLVVGAHFLPMGRAFRAAVLSVLGIVLVGVGVVGASLTLGLGPAAAPWTGVAAGATLLGFSGAGGRRSRPAGR